jgi:hypothetical protein
MSMTNYYGDYGLAEASALRRRQRSSLANQAAAFRGQKRGKRTIDDLTRVYSEGYEPLASSFGARGLGWSRMLSRVFAVRVLVGMRRSFNGIWVLRHRTFRMI